MHEKYVAAAKEEITFKSKILGKEASLCSLFIGGGTPTALHAEALIDLIEWCQNSFTFLPDIEISIEANPGTVDQPYLTSLKGAGVNRLSIGVQSFDDSDLRKIGRKYTANQAKNIVSQACEVGFRSVSLDLMYGLPGQKRDGWRKNLALAVQSGVHHLSIYQLSIEKNTPFFDKAETLMVDIADTKEIEGFDAITYGTTQSAGFDRYEISNYAMAGHRCHHNLTYWNNQQYVGIGAGAVEYLDGVRSWNSDNLQTYMDEALHGRFQPEKKEQLSNEESFRETVVMGLRLVEGVNRTALKRRFGIDYQEYYGETLKKLADIEVVEMKKDTLRLTERGMMVANSVMAELV